MELSDPVTSNSPHFDNVENTSRWYVLRDLKRPNDKSPAYKVLAEAGFEVFTPMKQKIVTRRGVRVREEVPFLSDLLFVHASKRELDPEIEKTPTLQYRYIRGGKYQEGMTVDNRSMEIFIKAVKSAFQYNLYQPSELTEKNIGAAIRIVGGPLDGCEGNLLKVQGSKKKRLLVAIENFITASVEIDPEYIQVVSYSSKTERLTNMDS